MQIAEIFSSIAGECNGFHQGRLVTFIRTSGCSLQCSYCDTKETQDFNFGTYMDTDAIIEKVESFENEYICITGGEPLLHPSIILLLNRLSEIGYKISIETNGTIDITPFHRWVDSFIIDYKFQYANKMILSNFYGLRNTDVVKFVCRHIKDIDTAIKLKTQFEKNNKAIFAFSPVHETLSAKELANILITKKVKNSVLSLQVHKLIGVA